MQLSRKEREMLASDIQQENEILKKIGGWIRNSAIFALVCAGFAYWGWSGMIDPLVPNASDTWRTIAKWGGTIGAVVFGLFAILAFLSHRNGKKSVMRKIDMFEESKASKTTSTTKTSKYKKDAA